MARMAASSSATTPGGTARSRSPDGSRSLLSRYDGEPETYLKWATDYFDASDAEGHLTPEHARHVYAQEPLTAALVKEINPKLTLRKLNADIVEIGYPKGTTRKK